MTRPKQDGMIIEPATYREVLGQFPTGVCVVTASDAGAPVGLAVGSFTSVSLDPPLVGFFPDRSSASWPRIAASGSFCVNLLSDDQQDVCRRFAAKADDKFSGLEWTRAGSDSPLIDGSLAWIDCDIERVLEAGDHYCVLGRVRELKISRDGMPLVFFRGRHSRLAT